MPILQGEKQAIRDKNVVNYRHIFMKTEQNVAILQESKDT